MTRTYPDLIVLKGAPGVGKSTAAKLLASHFPTGVRVEVDTLRQMVISVDWTNQTEHRELLRLSANLASGFLDAGYCPVILVDTFSGDKIDGFLAALHDRRPDSHAHVVVLHASDETLRQRIVMREPGAFRNIEISTRINREAASGAREFERVVDTTRMSPAEVAVAVLESLRGLWVAGPRDQASTDS